MTEACLLGIDLGTSSVKTLLVAPTGEVLGAGAVEYPILQPQPTFAEQNPDDWWQATVQAVRQARAQCDVHVGAIGLSGQMHGTVLLDAHDRPLAPAVIWPDQRSARQVEEITSLVGAERLYRIAGSPVSTGFQAATVRWFQQERPAIWQQTRTILLPKDYLRWRMTGVMATDPSDAAGALLLDEAQRDWSDTLLDLLEIARDLLPPVQPSAALCGHLSAAAASELGLPAGVPVVTGAADTACSALGAGATRPDRLLLTISTGGQLVQPVEQVQVDRRGRIHTFCSALEPAPGQAAWYLMGAILSAGMALRWLRDNVLGLHGADAYAVMNTAAAATPAGANELLFLPYLVGERTPHMDPTARGIFFGLTLGHGRGDLVRAVMEGVAFACYDAYQVLAELGVASESVIMAGGGARSDLWQQIVADLFGMPVRPLQTSEQSALGAALLAGAGCGWFDVGETAQAWALLGPSTAPDAERHALYQSRFAAFRGSIRKKQGIFRPRKPMIVTVSANPALDLTLTVPAIDFDVVLRATAVERVCAGKGFNVSRFLKVLGVDNVAMAFAAGYTGQALEEDLRATGIRTDFVFVAGETRTNVVIHDPNLGRHIKVNQPGAAVTATDIKEFLVRAQERAAPGDIWVLTGSLVPGMQDTFYADLTSILHAAGAQVVLDSSGAALRLGCAARPRLVKPNVVEAAEFTGREIRSREDAAAALQAFAATTGQAVILSLGKEGALVGDRSQIEHLQPPPVKVKTAVRAGDALVAGAIWAMAQGMPLAEIGRWGVTVGTVTAQRDALEADPWPELRQMYNEVRSSRIKD